MNNNLTNNTIPHRENNDLFVEVQTLQLKETTSSLIYDAFSKAQASEISDTTSSQLSPLMDTTSPTDTYSPRNITEISNHDILPPPQCIRQIGDMDWCIVLARNYGREFILVQNTMYSDMQLHFIVKDPESQEYKKWYLSVSKEKPIVYDMKFNFRNDDNALWEYLKSVENEWIAYNGGEFSEEEINFARQ